MEILYNPICLDSDCEFNVCNKCHEINTLLAHVPGTIYTCDGAKLNFKRPSNETNNIFIDFRR